MRYPGVVADSSVLVAALTDVGEDGRLSAAWLSRGRVAAPRLAVWEAANVLRRREMATFMSASSAADAHRDLLAMPVEWSPYAPLASRAWELRQNVSIYDASYVALAELLDAPLATLDRRLARAPGIRCEVLIPST